MYVFSELSIFVYRGTDKILARLYFPIYFV